MCGKFTRVKDITLSTLWRLYRSLKQEEYTDVCREQV